MVAAAPVVRDVRTVVIVVAGEILVDLSTRGIAALAQYVQA
ncbi:hypothetical protein Sviol_44730 [Streptomyces violascens]|uniref:Uncharacterized protein n=1 Tax=Streptomyces violascens TaxID=67381 RepID=A0ABQ3QS44_9ACTN|nr:hypothetical protein Sviol_44730 [Streptomyces violascens]